MLEENNVTSLSVHIVSSLLSLVCAHCSVWSHWVYSVLSVLSSVEVDLEVCDFNLRLGSQLMCQLFLSRFTALIFCAKKHEIFSMAIFPILIEWGNWNVMPSTTLHFPIVKYWGWQTPQYSFFCIFKFLPHIYYSDFLSFFHCGPWVLRYIGALVLTGYPVPFLYYGPGSCVV